MYGTGYRGHKSTPIDVKSHGHIPSSMKKQTLKVVDSKLQQTRRNEAWRTGLRLEAKEIAGMAWRAFVSSAIERLLEGASCVVE